MRTEPAMDELFIYIQKTQVSVFHIRLGGMNSSGPVHPAGPGKQKKKEQSS
jgi:hypothetical protein